VSVLAVLRAVPGIGLVHPMPALEPALGWVLLPSWAALAFAVVGRHRALGAVSFVAAAAHAALLVSVSVPAAQSDVDADAPRLRFVTANLYAFNARGGVLARELAALDADVLALEELTPSWLAELDAAGLLDSHAHRVIEPRDDCFGIALLSRFPIALGGARDLVGVPMIDVVLDVDERPVRVVVAHTMPPMTSAASARWRAQIEALSDLVGHPSDGATILTGDLNAGPFGRGYRRLVERGLRGAHESVGRGLVTTWPNGTRWLPPMRLDHVLVSSEVAVLDVRDGRGEGSDHRPVVAELAIGEAR
jgi:endonuclease/exonuclease/phosphatase (EEP) superfamily protein YafD